MATGQWAEFSDVPWKRIKMFVFEIFLHRSAHHVSVRRWQMWPVRTRELWVPVNFSGGFPVIPFQRRALRVRDALSRGEAPGPPQAFHTRAVFLLGGSATCCLLCSLCRNNRRDWKNKPGQGKLISQQPGRRALCTDEHDFGVSSPLTFVKG